MRLAGIETRDGTLGMMIPEPCVMFSHQCPKDARAQRFRDGAGSFRPMKKAISAVNLLGPACEPDSEKPPRRFFAEWRDARLEI